MVQIWKKAQSFLSCWCREWLVNMSTCYGKYYPIQSDDFDRHHTFWVLTQVEESTSILLGSLLTTARPRRSCLWKVQWSRWGYPRFQQRRCWHDHGDQWSLFRSTKVSYSSARSQQESQELRRALQCYAVPPHSEWKDITASSGAGTLQNEQCNILHVEASDMMKACMLACLSHRTWHCRQDIWRPWSLDCKPMLRRGFVLNFYLDIWHVLNGEKSGTEMEDQSSFQNLRRQVREMSKILASASLSGVTRRKIFWVKEPCAFLNRCFGQPCNCSIFF